MRALPLEKAPAGGEGARMPPCRMRVPRPRARVSAGGGTNPQGVRPRPPPACLRRRPPAHSPLRAQRPQFSHLTMCVPFQWSSSLAPSRGHVRAATPWLLGGHTGCASLRRPPRPPGLRSGCGRQWPEPGVPPPAGRHRRRRAHHETYCSAVMVCVPLNTVGWPDWYLRKSCSSYKTSNPGTCKARAGSKTAA